MTKILYVDDEPDISTTIKFTLELQGFSVTLAYDGDEGYRLAQEGDFDVYLLDVLLPRTMGDALGAKLKRNPRTARVPIIFLTNLPLESLTGDKKDGAGDLIQKDAEGNYYL